MSCEVRRDGMGSEWVWNTGWYGMAHGMGNVAGWDGMWGFSTMWGMTGMWDGMKAGTANGMA